MNDQTLHLRPKRENRIQGIFYIVLSIGVMVSIITLSFFTLMTITGVMVAVGFGVAAWFSLRTQKYAYQNFLGLRYVNTLHGIRWHWGDAHERITSHIAIWTSIDPKGLEKPGEWFTLHDIEAYGVSRFVERLQRDEERIDKASLSHEQRANFVFDCQVLGTEFQRQAEHIKRLFADSAIATYYQHLALYCQKEAKRLEASTDGVLNEGSTTSAEQGEVEELPNIGGSVRLLRHEGRVSDLRFYGLPHGEYTVIIGNRMKTLQIEDGAKALALSEMEAAPQAHGAFMINALDGRSDAVRW